MSSGLSRFIEESWEKYNRIHIALRIPGYLLAWPLLLGIYIFTQLKNPLIRFGFLIIFILFLQIPWISTLAGTTDINPVGGIKKVNRALSGDSSTRSSEVTTPPENPIIKVSYGAVTTRCSDYFMSGTLEVTNSGNTPISGRAEIPVKTYEKFMIPLSGVFLNLPPDSSTVINLEGGEGCKKGQVVGTPTAVFTIPSQDKLETLNQFDAFEWSNINVTCDKASALIRVKATARNTSNYLLTAGIQAYVSNGPRSQGQIEAGAKGTSYFGTIYKLAAGKSREIDFGYGGHCLKGRKGFDGPYFTEFETRFTY